MRLVLGDGSCVKAVALGSRWLMREGRRAWAAGGRVPHGRAFVVPALRLYGLRSRWQGVPVRYRTVMADSARWEGFAFRTDDVIISTPPKCGTTWTQMLCALIVFDGPRFPAPLEELSPWLDQQTRSIAEVRALYERQRQQRFIKTHTPLDGLPWRDDVRYVVVGRDPRDVAISMEHHLENMDMDRVMQARERAVGLEDLAELPPRVPPSGDPVERFRHFVEHDDAGGPVTLAALMRHLGHAWEVRSRSNVSLFHYSDYKADLPREMCGLARAMGRDLSLERAEALAPEASLERMRGRAEEVVPSVSTGAWRDPRAFLRAGASGGWRDRVGAADLARYEARVAELAAPDLARWVHLGRLGSGIDPGSAED